MAENIYNRMFQYPVGDTINFTNIINNAKKKLKGSAPKESYKALEDYLQGIFYPNTVKKTTERQKKINAQIREAMGDYIGKKLNTVAQNYSFNWNKINSIKTEGEVIPITEYESFSHKKYIEVQTLEKRYLKATEALEKLKQEDFFETNKFEQTKTELIKIIEICNSLLQNAERDIRKGKGDISIPIIKIEKDKSLFQLVEDLDNAYLTVSYVYDMPIPNWLLGEIFEKSLDLAFASMELETFVEKLTVEALEKAITQGQKTTKRGALSIGIKGYEIVPASSKNNNNNNFNYIVKSPTGNKTFKISGVFSAKQQKMDVEFDFGDEAPNKKLQNRNFKISAKNWKTISGSDFGETDLQGAILRNSSLNDAFSYGLQLGWMDKVQRENTPTSITYEQQLHHFARLNLLLDIVMGYSQDSGFVNTLIINDRQFQKIRVYSIKDILHNLENDIIKLSKCSNYNEEQVKRILGKAFDWNETLSTQEWEGKLLAALNSMKFNINTQILT